MILPDYLTCDADGYIHVAKHRIGLQDLIYVYNDGHTPESILETFPTLSLAIVHKTIGFYLDHRVEVDAYLSKCEQDVNRLRAASPQGPDTDNLRRRLAAKQTAGV